MKNQKVLTIATHDKDPWICNVYFSVDNHFNFFFISPPNTKHSFDIAKNPKVAFTTAWYDPKNLGDRKAIQGIGECTLITTSATVIKFLKNHYKYYPLWKEVITHKKMRDNVIQSRPYVIKPTYIKFWNDEIYGEEGVREWSINSI